MFSGSYFLTLSPVRQAVCGGGEDLGMGSESAFEAGALCVMEGEVERPCYVIVAASPPSPATLPWPLSSVSNPGSSLHTDLPTAISPLPPQALPSGALRYLWDQV